jgi:hypothetical protein
MSSTLGVLSTALTGNNDIVFTARHPGVASGSAPVYTEAVT